LSHSTPDDATDPTADKAADAAASATASPSTDPAVEEHGAQDSPPAEDASSEDASESEADALRAELKALRAEHESTNDRLLRTAAEMQNVRRRAAGEQRRRATSARAAALRPLLEVLDDLRRALAADADDGQEGETARQSLRNGVEMVEGKFEDALAGLGVEPIGAEGEPFDETLHEAMMQQPAPDGVEPGTVLAEIRRGYRMAANDEERVLRHSRVVVAAQPEASSPSNEDEGGEEDRPPNGSE
jgi:molecular chaperone GrpE